MNDKQQLAAMGEHMKDSEMMTPSITGLSGLCDAGFCVSFPNGFDGEPEIVFNGLSIECRGRGWSVVCAMMAASKWFADEAKKWESGNPYASGDSGVVYFNTDRLQDRQ